MEVKVLVSGFDDGKVIPQGSATPDELKEIANTLIYTTVNAMTSWSSEPNKAYDFPLWEAYIKEVEQPQGEHPNGPGYENMLPSVTDTLFAPTFPSVKDTLLAPKMVKFLQFIMSILVPDAKNPRGYTSKFTPEELLKELLKQPFFTPEWSQGLESRGTQINKIAEQKKLDNEAALFASTANAASEDNKLKGYAEGHN